MWRALVDAYQWSESVTDAYSNMPDDDPVLAEEKRFREALERVAKRYFGKTIKAEMNAPFKGTKLVSIQELRAANRSTTDD
jgi:hypothetical protein